MPAAMKKTVIFTTILILLCSITGCSTAYYSVWEKLGKEKRHLLKDNVEDVRDSQEKAQEEFKDALTRIKELYAFDGGELEEFYNKLSGSYEDCNDRAREIEKRIDDVKQVGSDLFSEWENEIQEIKDSRLKSQSVSGLSQAKKRFRKLETAMDRSKKRMDPVLAKLKDYVLYLKHNLNAQAVGALSGEVVSIENDVDRLIRDMNLSIKEADDFIKNF